MSIMTDNMKEITIDYRFLARVVIEAATPLAVHSGEKNFLTDAVVMKDVNGLPYIPGSSIAGVLRHAWKDSGNDVDWLFGFQKNQKSNNEEEVQDNEDKDKNPDGMGSRLILSEARILNSESKVIDGLVLNATSDDLLKFYEDLPVRQHVRMTHRGVAADKGKFDEQVVYTGTRFCFEMELLGSKEEKNLFKQLIGTLSDSTFRIGSGSRKGFGKITVKEVLYDSLPINDERYLSKSSNLEDSKKWYKPQPFGPKPTDKNVERLCYKMRPENFFLFGSGFGDDDADMTPVKEKKVTWEDGPGRLTNYEYLVPASSVKGALAHRTAFHYNLLSEFYADGKSEEEIKAHTGANNEAVRLLFGCEGDENGDGKQRGNVLFSDMYINAAQEKIINHVSIDRFTGGAIDGALFSEKAAYWQSDDENDYPLTLEILIDKTRIEQNPLYERAHQAFCKAIDDLCNGLLPLGGGVNRGHGIFIGKKCE